MQRDNLLNVFKDCDFSDGISIDNFEGKIIDNLLKNFSYKYFFGVSKVCIIPNGADYVIKIPFNGSWRDDIYEEEYEDFCNATNDENYMWDYCLAEVLYYKKAKKEKVHKIFCKTRLLGTVDNYPIYIQERAVTYYVLKSGEEINKENERILNTKQYCKDKGFSCFNPDWIADALDYYGEKTFNKMLSFIKLYNIGDLHEENIGYIGQRPVLIDYSEFNQ